MYEHQITMVPIRPIPQTRVRYATSSRPHIPANSTLGKILEPKIVHRVNIPPIAITHHTYKEDLKRADHIMGIDPEMTQRVIDTVRVVPFVGKVAKKNRPTDTIISQVIAPIKVKGDRVTISLSCPIEKLYVDHYSKGVMPPLKERVLAYSKIGYSDQKLAEMIKRHDNWKKNLPEEDKFIATIFGDASKKKSSTAPKKKTLLQMIGYKKPKYATIED